MNNIFVSTTYAGDHTSLQKVLIELLDAGISNIELGSTHLFTPDIPADLIRKFNNVYAHNYFPAPRESFILNLTSMDDSLVRYSQEFYINSIQTLARLNCKLYSIHPGFLAEVNSHDTKKNKGIYDFSFSETSIEHRSAIDKLITNLDPIFNCAKDNGIELALETQGSATSNDSVFFDNKEDIDAVIQEFKGLKLNFNLAHIYLSSKINDFDPNTLVSHCRNNIGCAELSFISGNHDAHNPYAQDFNDEEYLRYVGNAIRSTENIIIELRNTSIDNIFKTTNYITGLYEN